MSVLPAWVDANWLAKKYTDEHLSCPEIGRLVGRDGSTVRYWLRKLGIPTRPRGANGGAAAWAWKQGERSAFAGHRHSDVAREHQRQGRLADGRVPYLRDGQHWLAGAPPEANPNWKGGITAESQAFYNSPEWKAAIVAIWIRDRVCQRCEVRPPSRGPVPDRGHVHHIVSATYKPLRLVRDNLVLLCGPCHRWVHGKSNTERQFIRSAPIAELDAVRYCQAAERKVNAPTLFDMLALEGAGGAA